LGRLGEEEGDEEGRQGTGPGSGHDYQRRVQEGVLPELLADARFFGSAGEVPSPQEGKLALMLTTGVKRPEVLAPAGDEDSLTAALAAGADAVYFGLDEGFNARARAANFPLDKLPALVARIHGAGARAYLAFNTLIFEGELPHAERLVAAAAAAEVDALIVQDPAVAWLARELCPELEVHASTQMTISSPEGARFAEALGINRVVVPRELSVREIERFMAGTALETEVFIAGALCVSWSGQCLSSEAWGGRSANRGQCAQACRLPYELMVDGEHRPLGDVQYLLSPGDLAGFRAVPELVRLGVHTLKIEGRQKGPTYVHTAVTGLKRWTEAVARGATPSDERQMAEDARDFAVTYARAVTDGFLAGSDHQTLVDGHHPSHRGLCVGRVARRDGVHVLLAPLMREPQGKGEVSSPLPSFGGRTDTSEGPALAPLELRAGQGVAFGPLFETGGPLFAVRHTPEGTWLTFGQPGPDLRKVRVGDAVHVTGDPELVRRAQRAVVRGGGKPLALRVEGRCGEPLRVVCGEREVLSEGLLAPARSGGLDEALLREKLGAFGGTAYRLESLECQVEPGLFLPVSELKAVRRRLLEALTPVPREVRSCGARPEASAAKSTGSRLVALVRTADQLEAAIQVGIEEVALDWMELVGLKAAVERARAAGLAVGVATVRVQKPGEEVYDRRIAALEPDFILARHWGAVVERRQADRRVHGDFSLNVTNSLTATLVLDYGLETVTAAHDLDETQLLALLERVPASRLEVIVHHHIPTFHTEHCVYSHLLSEGRDFRSCGRPCEKHAVALRDRLGQEHPVLVDVGCRNTVFNAQAQSAAGLVPRLAALGVARLRVELVRESFEESRVVLEAYRDLLAGKLESGEVLRRVGAHEQFGVTRGTMKVIQ